jgi:hypothetical protein
MKMSSADCIVFVLRQSPDWEKLACDQEAGLPIDSSRYKPPGFLQGFPENIEACITTWNDVFPVNFYRCRQTLKDIAVGLLLNVKQALILSEHDAARLPSLLGDKNFMLFFLDDDDWFAPDTFEKVLSLDYGQSGIVVFPLVRFDTNTFTFVRQSEPARIIIGPRRDFHFRFQTNNYGISREIALTSNLLQLQDHIAASQFANDVGIGDSYFDVLISATNKTPCSASKLPGIVSDPQGYKAIIHDYVENLERLSIPVEMSWCEPALEATVVLFRSLLES